MTPAPVVMNFSGTRTSVMIKSISQIPEVCENKDARVLSTQVHRLLEF